MRKSILTIAILFIASLGMAQAKKDSTVAVKDTTISVQMNINQFRGLLYAIDQNIDSKKVSKELLEFLQKSAQIVQPKDKPKDDKP
jgi:hypothetical protein